MRKSVPGEAEVGGLLPHRPGFPPMALRAGPALGVVHRVAASAATLRRASDRCRQQQGDGDQNGRTRSQLLPRKNMATTVRARIAAKRATVIQP